MNDWRDTTLGDVLTLQRGFDITKREQQPGNVPVVSSGGISSYHNASSAVGPGVVIGRKGTLGKVFYLENDYWPHDTTLWVKDFRGNWPRFVYYFMTQIDTSWLDGGSANPTLNRNHLHPLKVRWPTVTIQKAIADVLGALDDKIAVNTKFAGAIDEYLSALFASLASAATHTTALGDIANVNALTVKPRQDGQLRYIDIASVKVGWHETPDLTDWADAPSRARRGVRKGDTIWSTVRPNRRSHSLNLANDPLLVGSTGLAVLSPRDVGFAYLYELCRRPEFTSQLENVAEGSAYPAVRADRFHTITVPMLPADKRHHFESIAAPLRELAHSLTLENDTMADVRDGLLPHLLTGKLSVMETDKLVPSAV